MTRFCWVVALGFALIASDGHAADATYDIALKADATKANGSPWDGVPGLGNTKANLNAAPDIAVCIVKVNIKPDCKWRPDGGRLFSLCQNSWTCKFPGIALSAPVGLVFIDVDIRNHDVIDTVMLVGNEGDAADQDVIEALRGAMSVLTPHRSEDAKERTVRDTKILPIGGCSKSKPCRLTQSELSLTRGK